MMNPFSPKFEEMTFKKLRYLSWLVLIYTIFNLLFFIFISFKEYFFSDKTIIIDVYNLSSTRTYQSFDIGNHSYVRNYSGKLYYHASSFGDMLLFNSIGELNICNSLIYLMVGIMLFFAVRNITEQKSFSHKFINIISKIAVFLFFIPLIEYYFQSYIVENIFDRKTNNSFDLLLHSPIKISLMVPYFIIIMLIYFLKKGNDLQEEQDLTV